MENPLDHTKWVLNYNCRDGIPGQKNGWDCGLYAVHALFCFALQAPLAEITPERIHFYCQKLILYLLDEDNSRDIMLPDYNWYQKVQL